MGAVFLFFKYLAGIRICTVGDVKRDDITPAVPCFPDLKTENVSPDNAGAVLNAYLRKRTRLFGDFASEYGMSGFKVKRYTLNNLMLFRLRRRRAHLLGVNSLCAQVVVLGGSYHLGISFILNGNFITEKLNGNLS